ncbi:hypothetical protein GP486_005462 [Trichoglossum hirsutum]|uniref:Uncharacterized protein n=1 Tax=Trichoglossum hirsutum TaxID=265104 RepID=A0A9P8L975_9PEZI|nr:hypothetical protein GP486_005462 [Trichoglossum hirsutum]
MVHNYNAGNLYGSGKEDGAVEVSAEHFGEGGVEGLVVAAAARETVLDSGREEKDGGEDVP